MLIRSVRQTFPLTAALCWLTVVAVSLYVRPLMPVDETRYMSVAWEMWQRNDFLVPFLNDAPYSHKPPLLFWLMHAGWWAFGVNELTPRLTGPFFGLLNLFLTAAIAHRLWPDSKTPRLFSPLILLSFLLWMVFMSTTMFDMLLTFFVLLGAWAILQARDGCRLRDWLLLGLAIGGGLLTKGPVVLLYLLPLLLLVRYWAPKPLPLRKRYWIPGTLLAMAIGSGIVLCWALPAATAGGEAYGQAILWNQTAGRVSKAFSHQRPFWWYLPLLPLVLLPWTFMGTAWAGVKKQLADPGSRFCLCWIVPPLLMLSLISSKQIQYLLPFFPAIALLFARSIDSAEEMLRPLGLKLFSFLFFLVGGCILALPTVFDYLNYRGTSFGLDTYVLWPTLMFCAGFWLLRWKPKSRESLVRNLCLLMVLLVGTLQLSIKDQVRTYYDFSPMAREIARQQEQGINIAHMGKYHNQFHFLGRLQNKLAVVRTVDQLQQWSDNNPEGLVIYYAKGSQFPTEQARFIQSYRPEKKMGLFNATQLLALLRE